MWSEATDPARYGASAAVGAMLQSFPRPNAVPLQPSEVHTTQRQEAAVPFAASVWQAVPAAMEMKPEVDCEVQRCVMAASRVLVCGLCLGTEAL
jgi:hypothetical protein